MGRAHGSRVREARRVPPHPRTARPEVRIPFTLDDFRGRTAGQAGELIRHEPVEHAVIFGREGRALLHLRSRPGAPHRVTVPIGKTGWLRGSVFVHNHPGGESFSEQDIWILLRYGAREVRAYGPSRAFRITAGPNTRRFGYREDAAGTAELHAVYWRSMDKMAARLQQLARIGVIAPADAWVAQTHGVVRRVAAHFGFAYREI